MEKEESICEFAHLFDEPGEIVKEEPKIEEKFVVEEFNRMSIIGEEAEFYHNNKLVKAKKIKKSESEEFELVSEDGTVYNLNEILFRTRINIIFALHNNKFFKSKFEVGIKDSYQNVIDSIANKHGINALDEYKCVIQNKGEIHNKEESLINLMDPVKDNILFIIPKSKPKLLTPEKLGHSTKYFYNSQNIFLTTNKPCEITGINLCSLFYYDNKKARKYEIEIHEIKQDFAMQFLSEDGKCTFQKLKSSFTDDKLKSALFKFADFERSPDRNVTFNWLYMDSVKIYPNKLYVLKLKFTKSKVLLKYNSNYSSNVQFKNDKTQIDIYNVDDCTPISEFRIINITDLE